MGTNFKIDFIFKRIDHDEKKNRKILLRIYYGYQMALSYPI